MSTPQSIRRRDFLHSAAGAIGLYAWTQHTGGLEAMAQGAPATRLSKEAMDKFLNQLEAKGRQMLSVPRKDGQFLNLLVKATRAKSVLEVGTSQGYSTIWMSLGLEETGGKLTTIDIDPEKVKLAKTHINQAGLSDRVTFHEGDAHEIVANLAGPFDFIFLDADKDGQMDYFKKLHPHKLTPGGVLAVHNAIHSRNAMREYLEMISAHPDFDSVILSLTMDDGFSVSYRKRI